MRVVVMATQECSDLAQGHTASLTMALAWKHCSSTQSHTTPRSQWTRRSKHATCLSGQVCEGHVRFQGHTKCSHQQLLKTFLPNCQVFVKGESCLVAFFPSHCWCGF